MSRVPLWPAVGLAVLIMNLSGSGQQSKPLPQLYATGSVNNQPHVVPRPQNGELRVPQGFSIDPWAEGFAKPRFMLQGSRGEVLVADSGGVIYVIPEGQPSGRKKLVEHLDRPYGLALWKNYLYVAETQSVKRYPYDPTKLEAGPGEQVISLAGLGRGHWTRSLLFDRAGSTLYVGIGSGSNVSPGEDARRAAINRYNPDGTGHEIFASGRRNLIGLQWHPDSNTLWAAVQERDEIGDDLPSDYLTHVEAHDSTDGRTPTLGQTKIHG